MKFSVSCFEALARTVLFCAVIFVSLFSIAAGLYLVLRQDARKRAEFLIYSASVYAAEGPDFLGRAQMVAAEGLGLIPFDAAAWLEFSAFAEASRMPVAGQAKEIAESLGVPENGQR